MMFSVKREFCFVDLTRTLMYVVKTYFVMGLKWGREGISFFAVKRLSAEKVFCTTDISKEGPPLCIKALSMEMAEFDKLFDIICIHANNRNTSVFKHLKVVFCEQFPLAECGRKFVAVSKCRQKIAILNIIAVAKPGYVLTPDHTRPPPGVHYRK